MRSNRNPT